MGGKWCFERSAKKLSTFLFLIFIILNCNHRYTVYLYLDCVSSTKQEPSSSSTPEPSSSECPQSNGLFPNPDDCASFYQCANGRSHLIRCPSGLHFSPEDSVCERPCVAGCDTNISKIVSRIRSFVNLKITEEN